MRTQTINFPEQRVLCVFPDQPANLAEAISALGLKSSHPVIVLIGSDIQAQQAVITQQSLQNIAQIAEEMKALVICGSIDLDVMAAIGKIHQHLGYKFPLIGVAPEAAVTWPKGPRSTNFLWWGNKRWMLASYFSYLILVPGDKLGDETSWIVEAATLLSTGLPSVTILINGGNASRNDIELSIKSGRPVIALGGTGQLANELAMTSHRNSLITVVPAHAEDKVCETIRAALSTTEVVA